MKVRIKTNVGVFRVEISNEGDRIASLRQIVIDALRILDSEPSNISLSFDIEHVRKIDFSEDKSISAVCGTDDGVILFLEGKFEKIEVKKAYIDGDGVVVKEGTLLRRIQTAEPAKETKQVEGKKENSPPADIEQNVTKEHFQKFESEQSTQGSLLNSKPADKADSTGADEYNFDADELDIRAPDQSQQMQLIETTSSLLDAEVCKPFPLLTTFLAMQFIHE